MVTKYQLYICDVTRQHKPVARFESESPFMAVAVGDRFDDHGWHRLDGVGVIASESHPKRYVVHSIKHTVVEYQNVLTIQTWLNLHPYDGPRSPAWGDDNAG